MRETIGRVAAILRQCPILWLPIVVADPLAFAIKSGATALRIPVALFLSTTHSVVGNTPEYLPEVSWKADIVLPVLTITSYFFSILLYTSALLATQALLESTEPGRSIEIAFSAIRSRARPALIFSLKMLGIVVVAGSVSSLLIVLAIFYGQRLQGRNMSQVGWIVGCLMELAIAWLITPIAFSLLRHQPGTLNTDSVTRARFCSLFAVVMSMLLPELAYRLEPQFILREITGSAILFMHALGSLISALPYVPLFIALSLIANPISVPDTPPKPEEPDEIPAPDPA